jgi:hypothetical protein
MVARIGDTTGVAWPEINKAEKLWTVPAARVKGKKGRTFRARHTSYIERDQR